MRSLLSKWELAVTITIASERGSGRVFRTFRFLPVLGGTTTTFAQLDHHKISGAMKLIHGITNSPSSAIVVVTSYGNL